MTQKEYELTYKGKVAGDKILAAPPGRLTPIKSIRTDAAWRNLLVFSDNLYALSCLLEMKQRGDLKCADGTDGPRLVYIDPPFSTRLEFKARHNQKAYNDKAVGAEFVESLRKRLILLRELLADDGSVYVHLDWKKAHYIKVIMDEVFGEENFLNDIVWNYGGRGAKHIAGQFSRNHDIILWYRKGQSHVFNQLTHEKRVPKKGSGFKQDEAGRWFKTSPRGDYTDGSMEALSREGRVYTTRTGKMRVKYFLREDGNYLIEDKLVGDVWDDIPDAMHISGVEKTGYPTQKPEALLERIIKASSNPGDLVLDCYAGAGTALCVSEKLGRRWIGIDSGRLAVHTIEKRLLSIARSRGLDAPKRQYGLNCRPFDLLGADADGAGCGCDHEGHEPMVKCKYDVDDASGECVVRIERFSAPGTDLKGMDALSSVSIDFSFDNEAAKIDSFLTREELEKTGFEFRFPAGQIRGEVLIIFADIFGHEKWLVGEVV